MRLNALTGLGLWRPQPATSAHAPAAGPGPRPRTAAAVAGPHTALRPATPDVLSGGEQGVGATDPIARIHRLRDPQAAVVPATLKVGLAVAQDAVTLTLAAPATVNGVVLAAGQPYTVRASVDAPLQIKDATGKVVATSKSPLRLEPSEDGPLRLGAKPYRGALEVLLSPGAAGKVTVVNDVGLEDYLKGVLPSEMATGWPGEALKAQAVAARTYAAGNMGRHADLGFDLYPTVSDQVYKGLEVEAKDTTAAVDATRGEVMTYQGVPINALFFASSGGHTDEAMAVWGLDLPSIKGVPDPDASPNAHWSTDLSLAAVRTALTKLGVNVGKPTSITVTQRTEAGRARLLRVTGDGGTETVDANKFRLAIGLKSTKITLAKTGEGWHVEGGGYGHGLGMSQWGARTRAEAGVDYKTILSTYYTGIALFKPSEVPPAPQPQ